MAISESFSEEEVRSLKQLVGINPSQRSIPKDHAEKLVRLGFASMERGQLVLTVLGRTEAGLRRSALV